MGTWVPRKGVPGCPSQAQGACSTSAPLGLPEVGGEGSQGRVAWEGPGP